MGGRDPADNSTQMAPARAPRLAACLVLALVGPLAGPLAGEPYAPKGERREILRDWELAALRLGGARPLELVAGIYELDAKASDFRNRVAITIDDCRPDARMAALLDEEQAFLPQGRAAVVVQPGHLGESG